MAADAAASYLSRFLSLRRDPAARVRLAIALALALTTAAASGASTTVAIGPPPDRCELGRALEILPDLEGRLDPAQAAATVSGWAQPPTPERFLPAGTYWGRLRIESRVSRSTAFVLLPDPLWHRVELYADPSAPPEAVTGASLPLAARALRHVQPLIPLLAEPESRRDLLLRFVALPGHHFHAGSFLSGCENLEEHFADDLRQRHVHGLYGGLMLAIVIYNLFLWFSVRDRIYLLYVLYAGSFASIWLAMEGVGLELLWPSLPGWDEMSTFIFSVSALVFGNRFVQAFLELPSRQRRISRAFDLASLAALGAAALAFGGAIEPAMDALALVALGVSVLSLAAGLRALRAGFRPARIFLVACGTLYVGSGVYALTFFSILPATFLTRYGAQIGSALEMVLLAFALGSRIRSLEIERRDAEDRYRLRLEHEVDERTASLAAEKARADQARQEAERANEQFVEANRLLERMTRVDGMTGVSNRRHFDSVVASEWNRCARLRSVLSVVLFDVDRFKAYNDCYGHAAGDDCLRRVAATLAEAARRSGDLVARYGGEEFVAVLPSTDVAAAEALAEAARQSVEQLGLVHAGDLDRGHLTISAGVAGVVPEASSSPEELLAAADRALYEAKRSGRNRVIVSVAPTVD